ncbi:hypothetical protein B0A52_01327 [Exophiala mesophila]|uniref:DNA ligase n=1 Tax=Exophiala mesophila TaxID=212818 RepID=A0A438NH52_EXOME|nr:hypothetical protein B0A52_01327 [Exophiala mesophila]
MSDWEDMDVDSVGGFDITDQQAQEDELDLKYPNRPRNKGQTLPFSTLCKDLFNPLIELRMNKQKAAPGNRRALGPNRPKSSPTEKRNALIERYISRWRREVGDDFYPAFRLIIPDKDRDRAMYGLKEKVIARLLVKMMKIDKNSDDAFSLLNWKLPHPGSTTQIAGDFPARCQDVISKRPMRIDPGNMTIQEVNEALDKLAAAPKEENQLPILTEFYKRMNADEFTWLIKIILRSMRIYATDKTFLHLWHPDAETLFNVSSSLRRVCYELYNPNVRLETEDTGVTLMQCFQPQSARHNTHLSIASMIERLRRGNEPREFWIEEKLDGERMQLHMISVPDDKDTGVEGGKQFRFWSRKAKEYTYLYGKGFYDDTGSLTQFIEDAFAPDVENIILDGEMITWDPALDKIVPFGTLKTAALSEINNPFANGIRPLFRVFDILLVNGRPLTRWTLQDRRNVLERSVKSVHRCLEIHDHIVATTAQEVEDELRKVIANSSEGLLLKNPRSAYRLDERNDDWQKVKPEYMTEFGQSLDCLIIGGYYGSGRRGGAISSFMCGLRAPATSDRRRGDNQPGTQSSTQSQGPSQADASNQRFLTFCKVGGGLSASDYATIRHETEGKWIDWDPKNPPTKYIDIGGPATAGREKPDQWIKPEDSLVIEIKAAEITLSDDYGAGLTLRFPRFKRLRRDKSWEQALSVDGMEDLRKKAAKAHREKEIKIDDEKRQRRKQATATRKKPLTIAGYHAKNVNNVEEPVGPRGEVLSGLTFYIMTESGLDGSQKKTKLELEALVKANGGKVVQTHSAVEDTVCVASRRTVPVASLIKAGKKEIIKPIWIFDCIDQARKDFTRGLPEIVIPYEAERHLYFIPEDKEGVWDDNVDGYGDSYARDTSVEELTAIMAKMPTAEESQDKRRLIPAILPDFMNLRGTMFHDLTMYLDSGSTTKQHRNGSSSPPDSQASVEDPHLLKARNIIMFAGGKISPSLTNEVTHIVASSKSDLSLLRKDLSKKKGKIPRIVTAEWVEVCWTESTRIDEEAYEAR